MALRPRRSSRLKEKQGEQTTCPLNDEVRGSGSTPSGSAEEETLEDRSFVVVTPSNRRPEKSNNFTKVYSSYNHDHGLDVYEGDFIDDSKIKSTTPNISKDRGRRRRREGAPSSSSSSDVEVGRGNQRKIILSSDEEEGDRLPTNEEEMVVCGANRTPPRPGNSESSDNEVITPVRKKRKRKKSGFSALFSSSEEEELCGGDGGMKKRRRKLKQLESDEEELSGYADNANQRLPSSRAKKLKEARKTKTAELLSKLRSGKVLDDYEILSEVVRKDDPLHSPESHIKRSPDKLNTEVEVAPPSLAERILFHADADHGSSSEGESSDDWIVSDGDEGGYLVGDIKELLRKTTSVDPHLDLGSPGVSISDGEGSGPLLQDLLPSSPLPLHEALCGREGGAISLRDALEGLDNKVVKIDAKDDRGYTALMCASEIGDHFSLGLLLEAGATVNCQDDSGTTPLHLAALSGWLACIDTLVSRGHVVDCKDERGWPPLLYAHFQKHEECVIALMKAKPQQISVLGDLLKKSPCSEDSKRKTLKVVRSLLMSLAHHEAYYSIFNDFIRCHPSVLDEDGFRFFKHCMGLLSFENKQAWFKKKLNTLREYANVRYSPTSLSLHNISRDNILNDMWTQIRGASEVVYWRRFMSVTFRGESGICTGPRKEFYACLTKALSRGEEKLFHLCDDEQLILEPCHVLYKYNHHLMGSDGLEKHARLLELVGMVIAHAVFHGDIVDFHLTNPMIKQLLGVPREHPKDLETVDKSFYHGITSLLEEYENTEDLELTFTQTVVCPWTHRTLDLPICEGGRSRTVTDQNKRDYVTLMSRFKLEEVVNREMQSFSLGFWKVLPQRCLEIFTPSELALLISGVPKIDVEDWKRHTRYRGLTDSDASIQWFWRLVRSLKQEEKALLLKFTTGSSCVPAGGFSALQGLGGVVLYTISVMPGIDKVPQAATCFNTLKLPDYTSEQQFRNKMLIAIRYGCEGFEFT